MNWLDAKPVTLQKIKTAEVQFGSCHWKELVDKVLTVWAGHPRSLYLHVFLCIVIRLSVLTRVVLAPCCQYPQCGVVLTNALLVSAYIIANCNCHIDYHHRRNLKSHRLISDERCLQHLFARRWSDSVCENILLFALDLRIYHALSYSNIFLLNFFSLIISLKRIQTCCKTYKHLYKTLQS